MTSPDPLQPPPEAPNQPPTSRQFGLRGMFILMTATCTVLAAVSALGIRQPMHALGALFIVLFCGLVIVVIEGCRIGSEQLLRPRSQRIEQPWTTENPFGPTEAFSPQEKSKKPGPPT